MVEGNVYNRRLRSCRRSDATSSEDEEELEDITTSRSQRYGIHTPEPVQRTLILRSGDDLEDEDEDDSELEELDGYGEKVYCNTTYKTPLMSEKDVTKSIEVEEENDRDMETHEHRVRRSELKRRAAGVAACFKRPHNGSGLWHKIMDLKAVKKLLKYLRRLWRFILRNSFMAVNVLWLLAPLCCFVIAITVPQYLASAIEYVDVLSTKVSGARGRTDTGFEMGAMQSMMREIVDLKVLDMTKEIRMLQQTVRYQEKEIGALKSFHDLLRNAHNEVQQKFSLVESDSAITVHVQNVVAKHTEKMWENFLGKTSQLQQDLRSISKQQAQLSSVVMKQQEKMDFMQDMMKKAATAPTPDTANEFAWGREMRKEFSGWRDSFERELESEMQRKMQAVESRMLRVLQEEKQAFSSSADALRGLDATDPGILRVIEVAVQAVEIKKTGRVDHAALANGASVIHSERDLLYQDRLSLIELFTQLIGWSDLIDDTKFTSPSYRRAPAPLLGLLLSLGEIPWWLSRHNGRPETALSETMEIGSCWGFAGSSGRLSVKFALQIIADSITIDHIPAQIASDFSSAPNEFRILGISGHPLRETVDFIPFGNFSYASNGPASQTFKLTPLQSQHSAIDGITLEVLSNHGHPEYTCLYRFRVHGQPV